MSALAREAGVSSTFLYPHLKRFGVQVRHDRIAHHARPPIAGLLDRYHAGESVLSLAHRFKVSRSVIVHRLAALGITPRGQSESERLKWTRMGHAARMRQTAAAHSASRGKPKSPISKSRVAATRERLGWDAANVSAYERDLAERLRLRGLEVRPQVAIGPYNCDLATGAVAVEVYGGNWHLCGHHARRFPERSRYILDHGWHLYIVMVNKTFPLTEAMADDLVTFAQRTGSNPTARREYRVVRGDAQLVSAGYAEDDQLASIAALRRARNPLRHNAHVSG
jgi:very-short-patch-repair endonuclease